MGRVSKQATLFRKMSIYFMPFFLLAAGGIASLFEPERLTQFLCLALFSAGITGAVVTWKALTIYNKIKRLLKQLEGTALVVQGVNLKSPLEQKLRETEIFFDDDGEGGAGGSGPGGEQIH